MNEIKFKQKIDALKFNDNGLIPCVAQDHESKQVLLNVEDYGDLDVSSAVNFR